MHFHVDDEDKTTVAICDTGSNYKSRAVFINESGLYAWGKVHGLKFQPTQIRIEIPNGGYRLVPAFSLTKTESLYVATKFNDNARARLVWHWD